MKKIVLSLLVAIVSIATVSAQELDSSGYNPLGSKRIHYSDIMWKRTVIRRMDLREQQNLPLYARDFEIAKLIVEATKKGIIQPYENDSLKSKMKLENFKKNISLGNGTPEECDPSIDPTCSVCPDPNDCPCDPAEPTCGVKFVGGGDLMPKDFYMIDIKEDIVFDKQRSLQYHDIIAITLYLSADHPDNLKKIDATIASYSYKEICEKLWKGNPKALWINPYNDQAHHNLVNAFELRLFHAYIIKVSNPKDEYLVDTYGGDPKMGVMASYWKAFELLEFEHNLWEF